MYDLVREEITFLESDSNMHPDMEYIADMIKEGNIISVVGDVMGDLEF